MEKTYQARGRTRGLASKHQRKSKSGRPVYPTFPTKWQYRTQADAEANAAEMREEYPAFWFNAYHCLGCDLWHVGRGR